MFKGKEICVNGFQWCRTITITMPPTNFTANILCVEHNSRLSPIDEAGLAAFRVFSEAAEALPAPRGLLLWLLHTVLQLAPIVRGIELALGGGDESIGSHLPTLEAADANPMPGPFRPGGGAA